MSGSSFPGVTLTIFDLSIRKILCVFAHWFILNVIARAKWVYARKQHQSCLWFLSIQESPPICNHYTMACFDRKMQLWTYMHLVLEQNLNSFTWVRYDMLKKTCNSILTDLFSSWHRIVTIRYHKMITYIYNDITTTYLSFPIIKHTHITVVPFNNHTTNTLRVYQNIHRECVAIKNPHHYIYLLSWTWHLYRDFSPYLFAGRCVQIALMRT